MKKYAVVCKIGEFSARVEREFSTKEDAVAFAQLLRSSETNSFTKYFVFELTEE